MSCKENHWTKKHGWCSLIFFSFFVCFHYKFSMFLSCCFPWWAMGKTRWAMATSGALATGADATGAASTQGTALGAVASTGIGQICRCRSLDAKLWAFERFDLKVDSFEIQFSSSISQPFCLGQVVLRHFMTFHLRSNTRIAWMPRIVLFFLVFLGP